MEKRLGFNGRAGPELRVAESRKCGATDCDVSYGGPRVGGRQCPQKTEGGRIVGSWMMLRAVGRSRFGSRFEWRAPLAKVQSSDVRQPNKVQHQNLTTALDWSRAGPEG
jgi:hypothetical protein